MAGNLEFIKNVNGSSNVSNVDVTNVFSDKYDVYKIVTNITTDDEFHPVDMRLFDSDGTIINQAEYDYASQEIRPYTTFLEVRATGQTLISEIAYGSSNTEDMGGISLYVYNPFDSSSYTFTQSQSSSFVTGNGGWGNKTIGVHKNAEQISGVRFVAAGSVNLDTIEVSVYGVK